MLFSTRTPAGLLPVPAIAGYGDLRTIGELICAIRRFKFTTAMVAGLDEAGYERRYCYEQKEDARVALVE